MRSELREMRKRPTETQAKFLTKFFGAIKLI